MPKVGVHVSIAGSIDRAVDRAIALGCDTFQIFTRNPRGWRRRRLGKGEAREFSRKLGASGIGPAVGHMPYLPNLASPKGAVYAKSVRALGAELTTCRRLGIPYLVTHLGSHLGAGADEGLRRVTAAINSALSEGSDGVMLLLENGAGSKNGIGSTFEEIARIIDGVDAKERVGVCLDTCHAFAAGYDLRDEASLGETIDEFERALGLWRLRVVHINDSKGGLGSGVDRHEHIGMGRIGNNGFRAILRHKALSQLPMILETPLDGRRDDMEELRWVRRLAGKADPLEEGAERD
ncbi:MAG: deoxyribonuclease IV [Candidatus Bathyarchaeia archaeon]